jgi:hypothetical protein
MLSAAHERELEKLHEQRHSASCGDNMLDRSLAFVETQIECEIAGYLHTDLEMQNGSLVLCLLAYQVEVIRCVVELGRSLWAYRSPACLDGILTRIHLVSLVFLGY